MKVKPLLVIGGLLILFGLLFNISPKHEIKVIDINTPDNITIESVKPIANLITDPNDKTKLALFNHEVGVRLPSYDIDVQKFNDLYVLAASKFFKDTLNNKYDALDSKLLQLISSITTSDNHTLSTEEKDLLSKRLIGLSWALINQ